MQLYGDFERFPRIVWVGKIMTPVWQYDAICSFCDFIEPHTGNFWGPERKTKTSPQLCACMYCFVYILLGWR